MYRVVMLPTTLTVMRVIYIGIFLCLVVLTCSQVNAIQARDIQAKIDNLKNTKLGKKSKQWRRSLQDLIDVVLRLYEGTGSTFTRWGRPDCPQTNSSLVYSGYVGGSYFDHSGAASNYLCLTKEPLWSQQFSTKHPTYLYGAEYEFWDHTTFGKDLTNKEPPCAVCRSTRSTVIMIPGRNVCYGGWTTEYSGYLVAGYYEHKAATEFICLDINATTADRIDSADHNGKLIYVVKTRCGSLPCPPYKNDWIVTCVVCSK